MRGWIAAIIVSVVLGGCISGGGVPNSVTTEASTSTTTSAPKTTQASQSPTPTTSAAPEPPVAAFTAASADPNATVPTAGLPVSFDGSNSSDPAGGNLSFAWDFGDNETDQGAAVNHTFAAAGTFNVTLTVTSDASQLTNNTTQAFTVAAAAVSTGGDALDLKDASGDADIPFADFLRLQLTTDAANAIVTFNLSSTQPGDSVELVMCYNLFINKQDYEQYGSGGAYAIYDYKAGGDMAGAKVVKNGNSYTWTLPLEKIDSPFPWNVHMETRPGECTAVGGDGDNTQDFMPDKGDAVYG